MKRLKINSLLALIFSLLLFVSCSKENADCFDKALYEKYKNLNCTMNCPGVIGCDGKTYCNECDANKNGIKVVK